MNLTIDAGGTNLRADIWDNSLHVNSLHIKSSDIGLASWIESILKEYDAVTTIGIAYAGQVKDGRIVAAPNIDVDEYEIKKTIESRYNVTLKIENDLTCAVVAESKAMQSDNICALYAGTGLGLGVIASGKIVRGSSNMAAEIGHIPYREAPFKCGCGRSNCIELFASGSGIQKWIEYYNLTCKPNLEDLKSCKDHNILEMFETALLYAAGSTITLFNPEVLVLGGGIMVANPYLEQMIIECIHDYALPQALEDLKICSSSLENAPRKGALLLKDYDD